MVDKSIKKITIDLLDEKETQIQKCPKFRSIMITENDTINLDAMIDDKLRKNLYGDIIKIGVGENDKVYITMILYDYYQEQNVLMIYLDQIKKINNINRSKESISYSKVACADESIILLRYTNNVFEFSTNGKDWNQISSTGVSIDAVEILTSIYTLLKSSHGLTVSFGQFLGTLSKLINMFTTDNNEELNIVTRHISDLDGNIIIAGEDL